MKARCFPYDLTFKQPAGTSRGTMYKKRSWFVVLEKDGIMGIGECGLFSGLSSDDRVGYDRRLIDALSAIENNAFHISSLKNWPSMAMGIETAFRDLNSGGNRTIFKNDFQAGSPIAINGLVWMGNRESMLNQIEDKITAGFNCVKLKIGAIDFEQELSLLAHIRKEFTKRDIEIRVDANGAFNPSEALEKLQVLSRYQLHSIEQPIRQGQWDHMARLCEESPLPIALDEELIGLANTEEKKRLLTHINPQYIIIKPSLIGDFNACDEWCDIADDLNIGWWATSALESNIGLNAIAQWTASKALSRPQGLGTGALYTNNIPSPLKVLLGELRYDDKLRWDLDLFRPRR